MGKSKLQSANKRREVGKLSDSVLVKKSKKILTSASPKVSKSKNPRPKTEVSTEQCQKIRHKDIDIKNLRLRDLLDDYIQVKDGKTDTYIAKVRMILKCKERDQPKSSEETIKLVAIRYFSKKEIDFDSCDISTDMTSSIAENEVFSSDHHVIVPASLVQAKPEVLPIGDYQNLAITGQNTFYTRAKYDVIKRKLDPPFNKWEKFCICKKPWNPNSLYIGCESCDGWFHPLCVKIDPISAKEIEKYYCESCLKSSKNRKPSGRSKPVKNEPTSSKSQGTSKARATRGAKSCKKRTRR